MHDIFIDVIGYRKRGHRETEDTSITQPKLHDNVIERESISIRYSNKLIKEGIISEIYNTSLHSLIQKKYEKALEAATH